MPEDQQLDPVIEIVEAYRAVFHALQANTTMKWLDLDFSMAQLKTLFVLAREGPVPIGRAAELMNIGLPTASHLIERLVQLGLASRTEDQADRRRTLASLTEQGERLVNQLRQGSSNQLRSWIAQMSAEEQAALLLGLRALERIAQLALAAGGGTGQATL
jgi:MarR family transcriptional regulator, organic hydroperoxide resistance regulator